MGYVAVNAAGRQKSEQMEFFPVIFRAVHSFDKLGIFEKVSVLNSFRYSRKILINYSARTHIEVTDFAVAHLPVRETYAKSACAESCGRIFFHKTFDYAFVRDLYRVALFIGIKPVTVHNEKTYGSRFHFHNFNSFMPGKVKLFPPDITFFKKGRKVCFPPDMNYLS